MTNFNPKLAKELVESTEQFPVDFDELWQWVGFSAKHKAKEMLYKNFEKDLDFSTSWVKTPNGGRPSELIKLTIEASKEFALLAQTPNGKAYRRYLIDVEKNIKENAIALPGNYLEALKALVASEEEKVLIQAQKQQLQIEAAENKPYVTLGKASTLGEGEMDLGEFAKLIEQDFGKNKLIAILKDMGYLLKTKGSEPYQKYVERGWFNRRRGANGFSYTVITNKGQIALISKIKMRIGIQRETVKRISQSVQLSLRID